jgi:hypothetical protein
LKHIDDIEEKLMLEVYAANSKIVAETWEEMKAVAMVSIFDNTFDSLNTSCGNVSDEMSFSKSSDFWDKPEPEMIIYCYVIISVPM